LRKYLSFILVVLVILSFLSYEIKRPILTVDFLNTGNSDCIIIRIDDTTSIIDTGTSISSYSIFEYLNANGIEKIDNLIITHFDKDHVGSASKIINNYEVLNVYQTYVSNVKNTYYKKYLKSLKKKNISPTTVEDRINLEINGAVFSIIPPKSSEYLWNDSNNSSLIVELKHFNNDFLFCADIEKERISEFLFDDIKHYDVLKVPHHGYYEDNTLDFIKKISPKFSIITTSTLSCPSAETVAALGLNGSKVYFTDNGTVTVSSDGKDISIIQQNLDKY